MYTLTQAIVKLNSLDGDVAERPCNLTIDTVNGKTEEYIRDVNVDKYDSVDRSLSYMESKVTRASCIVTNVLSRAVSSITSSNYRFCFRK